MTSLLNTRLDAVQSAGRFEPAVLAAFAAHLESAPEDALFRMSPLQYAREQGIEERTATELFLHATQAGLLEFAWGVVCPGCLGFLTTHSALKALSEDRLCRLCELELPGQVDDNVEVAFTVSPAVRPIRLHQPEKLLELRDALALYLSPSVPEEDPLRQLLRDRALQVSRLSPGEPCRIELDLAPGRYLVSVPALHAFSHLEVAPGGPAGVTLDLVEAGLVPQHAAVGAGRIAIEINDRTNRVALVSVGFDPVPPRDQRTCRPPQRVRHPFLTGKRLLALQSFRDLFRAESIPAQEGLELKGVTVLFTDLKGSTAMYSRIGDLQAFDLVRRHFDVLREQVVREGGGVVKTIGDAIMASFSDGKSAMSAAIEMNRRIREVSRGGEELVLKIGLHTGPCIAVELNERLDYFGQTVNLAARVQAVAEAGEIVCTEEVWAQPGIAELTREAGLADRGERVLLKGIEGEVAVRRLA